MQVKCQRCKATTEEADYLVTFKNGTIWCCDCWEKIQAFVEKSLEKEAS